MKMSERERGIEGQRDRGDVLKTAWLSFRVRCLPHSYFFSFCVALVSYSLSKESVAVSQLALVAFCLECHRPNWALNCCFEKTSQPVSIKKNFSRFHHYPRLFNTVGILTEMRYVVLHRQTDPLALATFSFCHTLWVESSKDPRFKLVNKSNQVHNSV